MALPNAEIMIHQPLGGVKGQAEDIKIHADWILKTREKLNRIMAENLSLIHILNERAAALGCSATNFVTPSGLPAEGHVSTATDLAVISKAALDNETVRKIAGTTEHTIPATNMYQERQLKNFNMFLDGGEREVDGQVMTVEKYEGVFLSLIHI